MHKILMIAWRDYKATVCTKAFIAGLVIAPIFMGGGAIVVAIGKSRVDTREKKVALIDWTESLAAVLVEAAERRNARVAHDPAAGKRIGAPYIFEVVEPNEDSPDRQRLELSERVRRGEIHAFLEIGKGVLYPSRSPAEARLAYYAENPVMDEIRRWVAEPINEALRKRRLSDAGIAESEVQDLFRWISAEGYGLLTADAATGEIRKPGRAGEVETILLPILPLMVMFLLVMMGAMPQLQSVTEEKSQRIAEMLLGCVRPFDLMMGKLLGGVSVSLTGALVYVLGGIIVIDHLGLGHYVPYAIIPWFLAYLICAIFLYGALLAAVGSACNDATEAQSATLPAMLPILIPLFTVMPVVQEPNGVLATSLSFIPFFTPFVMTVRMGTPAGVPAWQPWVGLLLTILATLLVVWVSGRIFRVAILLYGTPPRLKNLIRWAARG